jgi:hypothetical protein
LPAKLPASVSPNPPSSWLAIEAGTIALYHAFPVYSDENLQALLGHGLIRLDFMSALQRQQGFYSTDMASVKLALKPGETLAASKLFSRLSFVAAPTPDQLRFQESCRAPLLAVCSAGNPTVLAYGLRPLLMPLRWFRRH